MARREIGSHIPEKRILLDIPQHPEDFKELLKDVEQIGCLGLFGKAWDVQDARMLEEIEGGAMEPAFRATIRAKYGNWTQGHWRAVYDFPDTSEALEPGSKGDTDWVKARFIYLSDHDGFKVADCKDPREQRLLQYVVPILNPEKPSTLTVTLARGIFSTLLRKKKINWAYLVHRNTQKWARNLDNKKGCPLAPFLYHLYEKNGCITEEEKKRLEIPPIPGVRSPAKKKTTLPGGGAGTSRLGPSLQREMAPPAPQPDKSSVREERRKGREDPVRPGGASAISELRTKRREDRPEGGQPGGVRPQREERQERRKDPEVGRPGGAGPQQELRTKQREDPGEDEERKESPQPKLTRKKRVDPAAGCQPDW